MANYARVQNSIVQQIHEQRTDDGGKDIPIEECFHPDYVVTLVEIPLDVVVKAGDSYLNGVFGPPPVAEIVPPTSAQILAERAARLANATLEIGPLQDLIDLGGATADDELKLLEWKEYRANVGKVQTQPGFPESVVWPEIPEL